MLLKDLPASHLDSIKQSLKTGFAIFKPDDVDFNLHRPFKTNDGKIVGMIDFKVDTTIENTAVRLATGVPFIKFNYQHELNKLCSELFMCDHEGEVYNPRTNKEAAVCIYVAINLLQGNPRYKDLGEAWSKELSPFLGA